MLNVIFFFFNDTATTEIYTLSLHDALPISDLHRQRREREQQAQGSGRLPPRVPAAHGRRGGRGQSSVRRAGSGSRSEEHTSELQSRQYLVCRLLLEKKKKQTIVICALRMMV